MGALSGKVALVTGASRGIGKGIALELGAAGATIYITGRTVDEAQPTVPLVGSIHQTAAEITQAGGKAVAVRCDHRDDAQVAAVIEQIQAEQGRLDILVNNAWAGYEGYHTNTYEPPHVPFWEKKLSYWDDNLIGVRWTYVTTALAVPLMIAGGGGLIVNVSVDVRDGRGNPSYNAAKVATDRLALEFAHTLQPHKIAAVALYPGLVRTEGVILAAQYFDMTQSESPLFSGRAVVALAADTNVMAKSGQGLVVSQLAKQYGFEDDPNPYLQ